MALLEQLRNQKSTLQGLGKVFPGMTDLGSQGIGKAEN